MNHLLPASSVKGTMWKGWGALEREEEKKKKKWAVHGKIDRGGFGSATKKKKDYEERKRSRGEPFHRQGGGKRKEWGGRLYRSDHRDGTHKIPSWKTGRMLTRREDKEGDTSPARGERRFTLSGARGAWPPPKNCHRQKAKQKSLRAGGKRGEKPPPQQETSKRKNYPTKRRETPFLKKRLSRKEVRSGGRTERQSIGYLLQKDVRGGL